MGVAVNLHGDRFEEHQVESVAVVGPCPDFHAGDRDAPLIEEDPDVSFEDAGAGRPDHPSTAQDLPQGPHAAPAPGGPPLELSLERFPGHQAGRERLVHGAHHRLMVGGRSQVNEGAEGIGAGNAAAEADARRVDVQPVDLYACWPRVLADGTVIVG